jgi:predicted PurR-regulated permease PerM
MSDRPGIRRIRSLALALQRRDDMFETAVIATIVIAALYFGRTILMPLAIAVVLAFVLTPIVLKLRAWGLSNVVAVACTTVVALAALACVVVFMSRQVVLFAEDLPRYQYTLVNKIKRVRDLGGSNDAMSRAADTLKSLQREIEGPATAASQKPQGSRELAPIPVRIDATVTPLEQLRTTMLFVAEPLTTIGFIVVFVVVLLLYRDDVRDRVIRLTGVHDLERTRRAMDDAGARLNRYFLTTTLINTAFGIVIGFGLWAIGIPNPLLWGVLALMSRYIPFAGVPIAALLPVMLARRSPCSVSPNSSPGRRSNRSFKARRQVSRRSRSFLQQRSGHRSGDRLDYSLRSRSQSSSQSSGGIWTACPSSTCCSEPSRPCGRPIGSTNGSFQVMRKPPPNK